MSNLIKCSLSLFDAFLLVRQAAHTQNFQRGRARGRDVSGHGHHVGRPAVVVIDSVVTTTVPMNRGSSQRRQHVFRRVVVPDLRNDDRAVGALGICFLAAALFLKYLSLHK